MKASKGAFCSVSHTLCAKQMGDIPNQRKRQFFGKAKIKIKMPPRGRHLQNESETLSSTFSYKGNRDTKRKPNPPLPPRLFLPSLLSSFSTVYCNASRRVRNKNQNSKIHSLRRDMIIIIISLIFHQTWWNSKDFAIITQIHSSASFLLLISVINSRHWYGKPPTLLRDLGAKNQLFCSKSTFLKRRKDDARMMS